MIPGDQATEVFVITVTTPCYCLPVVLLQCHSVTLASNKAYNTHCTVVTIIKYLEIRWYQRCCRRVAALRCNKKWKKHENSDLTR